MIYAFAEFRLDPQARRLLRGDETTVVTPKAFDLLVYLVTHAGEVVSRQELLGAVWPGSFVEESNIAQHVFALRRALGDCASFIATIPGRGYQFVEPVRGVSTAEESEPFSEPLPKPSSASLPVQADERPVPWVRRHVGTLAVAIAAVLLASVPAGIWLHHRMSPSAPRFRRVLVADVDDASGDPGLKEAMRQALEIGIGQSPYVEVMGRPEVLSLLGQMGRTPATAVAAETARELCVRANRDLLLEARVLRREAGYRVSVSARTCAKGTLVAGDTREVARLEELLRAVDSIAAHTREQLGETLAEVEHFDVPLEEATTPSLEALKAYSEGESMLERGVPPPEILPLLQRAVALDPQFALGHAALAGVLYAQNSPGAAAVESRRAFETSGRVSEREKLMIETHFHADTEGDLEAAIRTARLWAATFPHDFQAWETMNEYLNDVGQYAPAIEAGQKALALGRAQAVTYSVLARSYRRAGRFAEARALCEEAIRQGVGSPGLRGTLYLIALVTGDVALVERERAWGQAHVGWYTVATEGELAFSEGRLGEAQRLYRLSRMLARRDGLEETADVIAVEQATFEEALGATAAARQTLLELGPAPRGDKTAYALVRLRLGDPRPAAALVAAADPLKSKDTLDRFVHRPSLQAALLAATGNAGEALEAMRPTEPYDLIDFAAMSQRAGIALASGRLELAAEQYRKILTNAGVDNESPYLPLAHLGLARTLARQGNRAGSRQEYELFVTRLGSAERGLPVVLAAKSELERLP